MELDQTIKDDMYNQVRLQTLESCNRSLQIENEDLQITIASLQNRKLFCLNCQHCRYDDIDCICTLRERMKLYIKPDGTPCENFIAKVYESKI